MRRLALTDADAAPYALEEEYGNGDDSRDQKSYPFQHRYHIMGARRLLRRKER